MRRQSCGCELAIQGYRSNDELVVGSVEGILVRCNVVLKLVIAPAMGAKLMLEIIGNRGRRRKRRLPVGCG